jgi:hypothetical protein
MEMLQEDKHEEKQRGKQPGRVARHSSLDSALLLHLSHIGTIRWGDGFDRDWGDARLARNCSTNKEHADADPSPPLVPCRPTQRCDKS